MAEWRNNDSDNSTSQHSQHSQHNQHDHHQGQTLNNSNNRHGNSNMNDFMEGLADFGIYNHMKDDAQGHLDDLFLPDIMDHHDQYQLEQQQQQRNEEHQATKDNDEQRQQHYHGVSPAELFASPLLDSSTSGQESFTPLLSPAYTPLDTSSTRLSGPPDFTMPGSYFSPSQSPMIEASTYQPQNQRRPASASTTAATTNQSRWRSSASNTPILPAQSRGVSKQSKQKQRVKTPNFPPSNNNDHGTASESVSPEELPEIAMPPPQKNNSNNASSSGRKESTSSTASEQTSQTPATPASLMNLSSEKKNGESGESEERLQNALKATTNGFYSKKVRNRSASTSGTSPSPRIAPSPRSSTSAIAPGSAKLKPKPSSSSSSSSNVPKISPSIKPKTMSASPAASPRLAASDKVPLQRKSSASSLQPDLGALLASKSNYQNIVEGNQLLSYPEQLSADLTSKRTSHKLAEQGRRNRINVALQELGDLVAIRNGGQVASKATTVELAIDYIKELSQEVDECKQKLARYEKSP